MISTLKPVDRVTQILQDGLADNLQKLPWYRDALLNPSLGFRNSFYRDLTVEMFNKLTNIVLNDTITYNRVRQILLQEQRRHEEKEPEVGTASVIKKLLKEAT